jgi:hypothetical protein
VIVPGATHLFEERGTLEQVSELAKDFFAKSFDTALAALAAAGGGAGAPAGEA